MGERVIERSGSNRARAIARTLVALLAAIVPASRARAEAPHDLRVFAAASLAAAFGEIAQRYEQAHPGVTVRLDLAGSQQLAAQIEVGAAADVFASADERWMDHVRQRDLLADEPRDFAHNRLAVIVPRTNPARIGKLADLAKRGVKLVLAAEAVPVGAYSRELLARLARQPGYPPDFARRTLANVVSEEENVKSVVGKVQLGEADAGIVYRSDVSASVARYVTVLLPPDSVNVVAHYPIAAIKASERRDDARAFIELVLSPAGQHILERRGLIPVAPRAP